MTVLRTMHIEAMSLSVPDASHPNRMPFSGVLTRVDVASDVAPNGSNGKRILLTRAAAEAALGSLLGMGVGLKQKFDGHDPQNKIGIITSAKIVGDAVEIAGYLWASDFPALTSSVRANKADLGFSFEAANIAVENTSAEVLTITGLSFSGAAILLKDQAAYQTTSLAASAAKDYVAVHPVLLKALRRAGHERCEGNGDHLSDRQLEDLMINRSISERIELKQLADLAGIMPAKT